MSRRRQKTQYNDNFQDYGDDNTRQRNNYVQEMPLRRNYTGVVPDSLQQFQWELQNSLKMHKMEQMMQRKQSNSNPNHNTHPIQNKASKDYSMDIPELKNLSKESRYDTKGFQESQSHYPQRKKKRNLTEINQSQQEQTSRSNRKAYKKIDSLEQQLVQIKKQIKNMTGTPRQTDKLDKILEQMIKNREADRQLFRKQNNTSSQPQFIYTPMPMPMPMSMSMPYMGYPPPQYPPQQYPPYPPQQTDKRPQKQNSFKPSFSQKNINKARRKLKKYFYVVLFTKFLKSEARKLAKTRKNNFRKFYTQKFNPQILNLKNWLVQSHGYAFPVILQKQNLNLQFWKQKRIVIQKQKRKLLLKIVQIGLQKMKKECVPLKTSLFMQILQSLCSRGSFVMSRFWSAVQMENICISQLYGCIRAEQTLQKFLIGMVVFIKVLIFNMLLQPYKFDRVNFNKNNEQLMNNMYIIASIYYKLVRQVLKESYLQQERPAYYKLGNWLNVDQQFIIECCQPLLFNCDYPEDGQWINGMLDNQLEILEMQHEWSELKSILKEVIEILHSEMVKRRREVIKKQKFNLYH